MKTTIKEQGTTAQKGARKPPATTKSKADVLPEEKTSAPRSRTSVKKTVELETPTVQEQANKNVTPVQQNTVAGRLEESNIATTPVSSNRLTYQQIAERAFMLWQQRGYSHGHHVEDWLRAEAQLKQEV
jgi:hypothetical protein